MRLQRSETPPSGEHGFALIEMIVVVGIVAILMATVTLTFRTAKKTAYGKDARSAAATYDSILTRYLADNQNRLPTVAQMSPNGKPTGPLNLLGKPYVPLHDGVQAGRVGVSMNCQSPTGIARAFVSVCLNTPTANIFQIRVYTRDGDTWSATPACVRSNGTAGTPC